LGKKTENGLKKTDKGGDFEIKRRRKRRRSKYKLFKLAKFSFSKFKKYEFKFETFEVSMNVKIIGFLRNY
jgi:hypothetical protein